MSDATPLSASVTALTHYFLREATLGEALSCVIQATQRGIARADLVGITMVVDDDAGAYMYANPGIPGIDHAQFESGAGPCIDAHRSGAPNLIASTSTDRRWPAFCRAAVHHGVRCTLSLPVIVDSGPIGALTMYSYSENAFAPDDVDAGQSFASQAGFVLVNVQAYWDTRSLSENMAAGAQVRAVIERARGVIMRSWALDADEAFRVLVAQAQHQDLRLCDVASQIVGESSSIGSA